MLDNVELPTDGLGSLVEAVAPARAADETKPLAGLLAFARDSERAVQIAAFAQAFWRTRLGPSRPVSARLGPPTAADHRDLLRGRRLAACRLDAQRIDALRSAGAALTLANAVRLALG